MRLGLPDDYADRYLPEIMARFSRSYPGVELTVMCQPRVDLVELIDGTKSISPSSPMRHQARLRYLPPRAVAVGDVEAAPDAPGRAAAARARPADCGWRRTAIECMEKVGRPHRVLYSSPNAGAVASAVLAGLAVSVFPESGLRPGMRVLNPADGFPSLPSCRIGLVRNAHESSALAEALAGHIVSSLDNLSDQQAAE